MSAQTNNPVRVPPPRRRMVRQMLVVLALAVAIRLPLTQFPMGPSAGTIGYVGQRWLEGAVPYRDAWDHEAPGLYLLSGVTVRYLAPAGARLEQALANLLVGQPGASPRVTPGEAMPETCRVVMMALDLIGVLLVYAFVRAWCGHTEAVVAAGVCGFFGGALLVQGDCLGPWPAVNCLVITAMLAALRSEGRDARWLLASGLLAGLAACFELLALFYALAIVAWAAATRWGVDGWGRRWVLRPALVLGAAAVPLAGFAVYFWSRGALHELWRSAVVYNVLYRWLPVALRTPGYHWQVVRSLAPEQGALWLFAGGWALHAFSVGFSPQTRLVAYWGVAALAAALTTRQVVPADFLQVVPPLAIGAALAATNPSERFMTRDARGRLETRSIMLALLAAGMAAGFVYTEWRAYHTYASRAEDRAERAAATVADMIRDRTMPGHPIYVWGAGPQIYVLADRPAAHRIFYNRPLNASRVVKEYFGLGVFEDICRALIRAEPVFFVTTEDALPEAPDLEGPLSLWFRFMRERVEGRERYEGKPWRMEETRPYLLYVRKDRSLMP